MAKLVEEARNSKSKTRRFIDKFAQYYTPGKIKAMAFDKTSTLTDFQHLCAKISAYTHCFIGKDYVYNSSIMANLIYSSLASNVYSSFSGYQASRVNQVIQWQLRYSRLWKLDHALEVVHAELLREGKATIIKELKKEGPTAMIGDAPALAIADFGISKGISGSAPAIDTGHVILMSNDLRKVPKVIENVIMSMSTKSAILALAFAGHPLVGAAVLADLGTCLLVIFSSMLHLRGTHNHAGKCTKTSGALRSHKHGNKNSSHNNHSDCCSIKKVEKVQCGTLKCCSSQRVEKVRFGATNSSCASGGCSNVKVQKVQGGAQNSSCSSGYCCSTLKVEKVPSGAQNSICTSGCSTQKVDKVLLEAQIQGALQTVALARKLRRCRVGFKIQAVPQDVAIARKL
ncbi:hypothetical protein NC651_039194 [Populus alba x Populus x berolinensis]|nr:hypothetical protein NC651_039194 [Populus alba x Populus x berolinensis]